VFPSVCLHKHDHTGQLHGPTGGSGCDVKPEVTAPLPSDPYSPEPVNLKFTSNLFFPDARLDRDTLDGDADRSKCVRVAGQLCPRPGHTYSLGIAAEHVDARFACWLEAAPCASAARTLALLLSVFSGKR
jgi:hypothetical protein